MSSVTSRRVINDPSSEYIAVTSGKCVDPCSEEGERMGCVQVMVITIDCSIRVF